MNKLLSSLAFGLLGCALATTSAHAAPATGTITGNDVIIDANNFIHITVTCTGQNNTPTDGNFELSDHCYIVTGSSNYDLRPANPPFIQPFPSSQTPGAFKGPWTMRPDPISAGHGYTYHNDVVLTAALGFPVYRVQLDTNNMTPKKL